MYKLHISLITRTISLFIGLPLTFASPPLAPDAKGGAGPPMAPDAKVGAGPLLAGLGAGFRELNLGNVKCVSYLLAQLDHITSTTYNHYRSKKGDK